MQRQARAICQVAKAQEEKKKETHSRSNKRPESSLTNNKFFWRLTALGSRHSVDKEITKSKD